MKLTPRFALVFVLYAVALLVGVAWLSYTSGKESLRSATVSELQSTAIEKQSALNEWVAEKRTDITILAASPAVIKEALILTAASPRSPEARAAHDRFVTEVQPQIQGGEFLVIMLLDPSSGQVTAATDPGEEGKFKEDRLFFLNGKEDPYVQNVYYSISTQGPAMTAAAPLRSADGKLLGVLAGRLNLDEMNSIIKRHPDSWQTEEAFLVNTSHLFVTQPRLSSNPAVLQHGIHTEAVNRCLAGTSGTLYDLDYRNKPALIVYRWLPEQNLCLIVKIDQAEALSPAYAFGSKVAAISAMALLGAIILAVLFSRGITGPIRALQSEVIRFGQGELDIRLPEKSRDEIGDLAREFNKMAAALIEKDARLQEYATDLELKIRERTVAIKQREERYRSYIEVTGQIGWTTNPQGEVEEDIPSWRKYTGQSEEEVKGWGWLQALHPDDREHATQVWSDSVATQNNYEVEYRLRRYDGAYLYFLTRGVPVYKDNREIQEWVGTCIDITGRKRVEQEIANLSKFPTENPNPVLRVKNDGQIIYANKASQELLELWGCEVNDYLPVDMKNLVSELVESGSNKSVDIPCNDKVYSTIFVPIMEAGYVNLYGTDITERKKAEDALRESEGKLRVAIKNSNFVLAQFDWELRYQWIYNPHPDFDPSQVIGKRDDELDISEGSKLLVALKQRVIESGEGVHEEISFQRSDGTHIYDFTIEPILDTDGLVIGATSAAFDITERVRAEETLHESEERYRSLFENMLNGFAYCQMLFDDERPQDFIYLSVNNAFESLTGLKNVVGKKVSEVIPGILEADPGLIETYGRVAVTGKPEIFETYLEALKMWFSISVYSPQKGYFVAIFDVITERKRAEEALRQSQENFAKAFNSNPTALAVTRLADGKFLNLNEAYTRSIGYEPAEILGRTAVDMNLYVNSDEQDYLVRQLREQGRVQNYELSVHNKKGEVRDLLVSMEPILYSNEKCILSTFLDITERKQTEEALLASEARYRNTLDAMLEGCQIIGFDWRYLYLNEVADKHNRRSKEELLGKKYMDMWPGIESTHVFSVIRQCMQERTSQFMENEFMFPDGSQGWFELRIYPVPEGIVILSIDITERKHAEEELHRTMDDLRRSNAELEQFAYVASHDLQEPLRGIAGLAQLLQHRYQGQLDSRADEYIGHIVDGTQRMQTLINDLLAYSRIGRRGETIQPTEAETALKTSLENLSMAIQEYGASITNESLPTVRADSIQLTQLFQNLIGNALKFKSESPPQIHVGVADAGAFWQFSVQDNGIGIEPQYFERIFQVFQRLHTRREYSGTGIGLAICKKIIERHGGRIWVESEMGRGSTFYFTLPKE